ncbi:M3 family metallopeptidase [Psittacicella hinzii]|uniref:Peptidase M3A/M3B catalytic domain-containing protein n=1 Tax=Psittacicella hinzii TaxID=2028575 RepID=A0A3A1YS02_9GAMM|nr:M3 family metallopeptidase [Psittacicella hinzii]RIY40435.1 hypothetical protein CKF58_00605 [Psittacicella hinzii]
MTVNAHLYQVDFSKFAPENLPQLFAEHAARVRARLAHINALENPTLDDFYGQENYEYNLAQELFWTPIDQLAATVATPEFLDAYNALSEARARLDLEVSMNKKLYTQLKALANAPEAVNYPAQIKRDLEVRLQRFKLEGAELSGVAATLFEEATVQLRTIQMQISQNHMHARQAWFKHVTDAQDLAGLSASSLELYAAAAQERGLEGYVITLSPPVVVDVLTNAANRALRQEVQAAVTTIASPEDPTDPAYDNSELVQQVYEVKSKMAELLGFKTYAEYSLATKMAKTPEQVLEFLTDLQQRAFAQGQEQFTLLKDYAYQKDGIEDFGLADLKYYTSLYSKEHFQVDDSLIQEFFPVSQVLSGLFTILNKLYGITCTKTDAKTYYPDVSFYQVYDRNGELIAGFYLDLYARPIKRAGAWMEVVHSREQTATDLKLPVAYITTNFAPPINGKESTLTFRDVETLFHEMGHGLHLMLTRTTVPTVGGINVEWDAVELPSQIHENWVREPEALRLISKHVVTGQTLSEELFARIADLVRFTYSGLFLLDQIEYSLFDMELYHTPLAQQANVHQVLTDVRARGSEKLYGKRTPWFANIFEHIFTSEYAAGYYSYLWAEVLAADAYAAYKETGDIFNQQVATAFVENILAKGGTRTAQENYVGFRGKEASVDALLRHYGLNN